MGSFSLPVKELKGREQREISNSANGADRLSNEKRYLLGGEGTQYAADPPQSSSEGWVFFLFLSYPRVIWFEERQNG